MEISRKHVAILHLALILVACGAPVPDAQVGTTTSNGADAPPTEEVQVVTTFVDAYNRHAVDDLLALTHPDVEWLAVSGDGVQTEAGGQEALAQALGGYFEALPSARSELLTAESLGAYVTTHERALWDTDAGTQSQASVAVYEIQDRLVRRVWYFPAVR